jgi:ubiquitin carboxyl-terminal hydrolase 7
VHDVRLPKDSTVADVLEAVRQQLPEGNRPSELRLLEVFYAKIYKVRPCSLTSVLLLLWYGRVRGAGYGR